MSIKNKDGSVSVRAEDLKDFADTQKAINEGKFPQRTPDELAAMKAQVLTRTYRQKSEKQRNLSNNSNEEISEDRMEARKRLEKAVEEIREWMKGFEEEIAKPENPDRD